MKCENKCGQNAVFEFDCGDDFILKLCSECRANLDDGFSEALQFFDYKHLPKDLQKISEPFSKLAIRMIWMFSDSYQREMGLQKLLEAKDCAVRCAIMQRDYSINEELN